MRLLERWVGENGRNNVLLHLATRFRSSGQSWEHRYWDDTFQLVAAPDGYFVTLFTKKQDPSEKVLSDFMSGRFERVEPIRSQPRPTLLFRSVLSYGAEQAFGSLAEDASFPVIYPREPADTAGGPDERRPRNIAPFLSNGRALWIGYSFTEEKAHRFALHNASQCDRRIVTYCQPALSQHHRCNRPNVQVVSLPKLLELASPETRRSYMPHARFLLNNLIDAAVALPSASVEELAGRIPLSAGAKMPIHTSAVREARIGLGLCIEDAGDGADFLACANLLNAALNPKLGAYDGCLQPETVVYSFKSVVGEALENIAATPINGVACDFSPDGITYVTVLGVQFSFHSIPRTKTLEAYIALGRNVPQPWSGVRLQPIAPLIMDWASAVAGGVAHMRATR